MLLKTKIYSKNYELRNILYRLREEGYDLNLIDQEIIIGKKPIFAFTEREGIFYLIEEIESISELEIVSEHILWMENNFSYIEDKYSNFKLSNKIGLIIILKFLPHKIYLNFDNTNLFDCKVFYLEEDKNGISMKAYKDYVINGDIISQLEKNMKNKNIKELFEKLIYKIEQNLKAIWYKKIYDFLLILHSQGEIRVYFKRDFLWLNTKKNKFRGIKIDKFKVIHSLDLF
jgi:hypothetical protein